MRSSASFLFLLIHRKVHLAQQVLEARVGAQGIKVGQAEIGQVRVVLLIGFFKPIDGQVVVTSIEIVSRDIQSRYALAWLPIPFCHEVRYSTISALVAGFFKAIL